MIIFFFFFFFCSTPDPDPWSDSVCGTSSVQQKKNLIVICGFNISWDPNLVFSKKLARSDTPVMGSSLEIFNFLLIFFHQVPKKKIFFFILIENKFVLIFNLIGKKKFFASPGSFFWWKFLRFLQFFDNFLLQI